MSIEIILDHIVKNTNSAVHCYHNDLRTNEYGGNDGQLSILDYDPDFEKHLLSKAVPEYPVLYVEENVVVYAIVAYNKEAKFIIGPVLFQNSIPNTIVNIKKHHGIVGEYRIPKKNLEHFCEEVLLLHNFLNKSEISFLHLVEKNMMDDSIIHSINKELSSVYFNYHENQELHNPFDRELREVESIKQGDKEALTKALDESFSGKYGTLSKNPLQASKNLAICGMIIASRAAIAGGLLPELVNSICDSYILKIDESPYVGQPEALVRKAKFHYTDLVAQNINKNNYNSLVESCKNIIYKNMHSKILVKEIAEELSVNPDYLSHLFSNKEKITIHAFIEREKIARAVDMLIYSQNKLNEIGYYLGFSSQSHFGSVFKKLKGVTPKQFRDKTHLRK
jgi:YesN/AraC family two-component response regulator